MKTQENSKGADACLPRIVRLRDIEFTGDKSADANNVFLLRNKIDGIRPEKGWKVVGHGKAPWPGDTDGKAVMLEKTAPQGEPSIEGGGIPEGYRIWQHCDHEELILPNKEIGT